MSDSSTERVRIDGRLSPREGETENLSSSLTFFSKFVFPSLWISVFAVGTLLLFIAPGRLEGDPEVQRMRWIFLGFTLFGTALLWWCCIRIKRVFLSASGFIVSNYRQSIQVPFHDVSRVSSSIMVHPANDLASPAAEVPFRSARRFSNEGGHV